MPQQGFANIVPDQITGANTTDIGKHVGLRKDGAGGNQYILGFNAGAASVAAGAAMVRNTAVSTVVPYGYASTASSAEGSAGIAGVCAESVASSRPFWLQTAGTFTAGVVSSAGSRAALLTRWIPSSGVTYQVAATAVTTSAFEASPGNVYFYNAQSIAASGTSAVLMIVPGNDLT